MWSLPKHVLSVVLVVQTLAVIVAAATVFRVPVKGTDWILCAVLGLGSMVHLEAVRGIERAREALRAGSPYVDLKSVWTFAAVLLLPPPLAAGLVALTYAHLRWRVARVPIFRVVYSAATVVLATYAAAAILELGLPPGAYPGLPVGAGGVFVVILAGLARWFVNHGLVVMIILVASPNTPARTALGNFGHNIVEAASVSVGALTAFAIVHDPWYVLLIMPPLLLLHRSLLVHHYELAARTDEKTGLTNAMHWSETARRELSRAERDNTTVGILMIDLDHFKRINDTYGHLAGDAVLAAVADAMRKESRDYDVAGRFGGEEFVLLLPGMDPDDLLNRAERLRDRIAALSVSAPADGRRVTITGLTASVGVVSYPGNGLHLDSLLLAADSALYEAKKTGRNRTCVAPNGTGDSIPEARTSD